MSKKIYVFIDHNYNNTSEMLKQNDKFQHVQTFTSLKHLCENIHQRYEFFSYPYSTLARDMKKGVVSITCGGMNFSILRTFANEKYN